MKLKELKYERYVLSTRPTLWLPLYRKGGDTFLSSDGYGHLVTVTGATWGSQGRTFDGVDDNISCGDLNNALDSASAFTIMGWAKQTTIDQKRGIFSKFTSASARIEFTTYNDGNAYVIIGNGVTGINGSFDYSTVISAGKFFHYVVFFDGSGATNSDRLKIIINNNPVTLAFSGTIPATTQDMGTNPYILGQYQAEANIFWQGNLEENIVYNRASLALGTQHYLESKWRTQ